MTAPPVPAARDAALVVQTSFIGDMVLTTPLIATLRERGHTVDVLAIPSSAPLLANNPHVRDVIVYDKRGRDSGARGFLRVAARLRGASYGRAYFAQGSLRSRALGFAARIPERVGFESSAGRSFYTAKRPYDEGAHHAQRLFSLAFDGRAPAPRLFPGASERQAVDDLLASARYRYEPLVALAPGSAWGTKRWPYYGALAAKLSETFRILVIGGPEDRTLADAIRRHAPTSIDATGKLSLLASADAIRRCFAIVSNDSAPQHLASAMGIPTVTIFGPTVPEFGFGPLSPKHDVVGHDGLACRPCDRHGPQKCPLGHWRCMREIDASLVQRALGNLT